MRSNNTHRCRKNNAEASIRKFEKIIDLIGMLCSEIKNKILEILSIGFAGFAVMLIIASPLGIKIEALEREDSFKIYIAIGIALLLLTYEKIKDINKK